MPASDSAHRPPFGFATIALCLSIIGAAAMLYYHQGIFIPRAVEVTSARGLGNGYSFGNDFYQVWLAARECVLTRCDPYSPEMTRKIQTGLYGRPLDAQIASDLTDRRVFPYPAFTLLLFWPTTALPFSVARAVFVLLLGAVTFATVVLWLRVLAWRPSRDWLIIIFLLTFCSYPVLEGLYAGQLGLVVAFLLAASVLALQRDCLVASGILMALTTMKPQVTLFAVVYLMVWSLTDWRPRGPYCAGFFSTIVLLLGTSLAVWPNWIQSWLHTVLAYRGYTTPVLVNTALASHLGPTASGPATIVILASLFIVAATMVWRNRAADASSPEFRFTLSLLLAITAVTLLPGQAIYDDLILLPGIFLLARGWRTPASNWILRALLATGVAILLWPWTASVVLISLRPFLPHQQFESAAILSLPLRTAAIFPFIVLALLALKSRDPQSANHDGQFCT